MMSIIRSFTASSGRRCLKAALKPVFLVWAIMILAAVDLSAGYAKSLRNIRTVMLDPGHGGRDFGARSRNLALEKDVTRNLALTLKEIIETENGKKVKIFFTHSGAGVADQMKRSFNANSEKGDVYLSFHAASGFDRSPRDLGIYISEKGKFSRRKWEDINKKYSAASGVLAEKLRKKLDHFYTHKTFIVKSGSFLPLYGINMPALLVEVIALNDPVDELMLNEEDFYERLAAAFYEALVEYDRNL